MPHMHVYGLEVYLPVTHRCNGIIKRFQSQNTCTNAVLS